MINFAKGIFTNKAACGTSDRMPLSPGYSIRPVSKLNSRGGSASTGPISVTPTMNASAAEPIYGESAGGVVVGRRNGPTIGLRMT